MSIQPLQIIFPMSAPEHPQMQAWVINPRLAAVIQQQEQKAKQKEKSFLSLLAEKLLPKTASQNV